uniref:Ig-like domain-containing protein n=1 Tax=Oncorhynchus kisutch TaxID=8019 RepID=A0A8C7FSR1_ONCKI
MYCYLLSLQTNSLADMPKLTLIRLCFWLCLARMVVSGDLYHQVEGDLVLKPEKSTVPDHITSILWKHGKNKVAEWYKDYGLDIYGTFINRTTLDQTTGELRISGLMKTDSGVYSVEFNSKLLDKTYTLSVIKAVPKPTITSSCNPDKTSCTLTCEGDTTDAEPVTYSWKEGEGPWVVGGKLLIVSKSHTGNSTNSYNYICKLNNTVSGEVSEPGEEVFGSEPSNRDFVGVVVTAIVATVFIVITGMLVWKKKKGRDGEPKRGGGTGAGGGPAAAAIVEAAATAEANAQAAIVEEAAATIAA